MKELFEEYVLLLLIMDFMVFDGFYSKEILDVEGVFE